MSVLSNATSGCDVSQSTTPQDDKALSGVAITFPALIKLEGDHELVFVADETVLYSAPELKGLIASDQDWLVDSCGWVFPLASLLARCDFTPSACRQVSLTEVTTLIREHEFSQCQVCLTKIEFADITSAVASLSYLAQ